LFDGDAALVAVNENDHVLLGFALNLDGVQPANLSSGPK